MAKTFIGLDLSGLSWKSVVVSTAGKDKLRIHGFFTFDPSPLTLEKMAAPEPAEPEDEERFAVWAGEVGQSIGDISRDSSGVIVGVPQFMVSMRVLELPFTQRKKIEQTLPFEAESTLPFDVEDLVFDYFPVAQAEKMTRVVSAAARKENLSALLGRLSIMSLDPAMISPTASSYHYLARLMETSGETVTGRSLFIDVSERRTHLAVVESGRTVFSSGMEMGPEPPPPPPPPEDGSAPGPLPSLEEHRRDYAARLVLTIERLAHWLEGFDPAGEGLPPPLSRIVLLGDFESMPGLDDLLTERTGVKAQVFRIPAAALSEDTELKPELHPAIASSLALALEKASPDGLASLNFRKGELAYQPESRAVIRRAITPAALLLVLFMVLGARTFIAGSSTRGQADAVRRDIQKILNDNFPGATKGGDPVKAVDTMMVNAKDKGAKYEELSYPSAVTCLAAVSAAIPRPPDVVIHRFEYQPGGKISMSGDAKSIEGANEVEKRLKTVPIFKQVKLGRISTKDQWSNFTITIELHKRGA